MKQIQVVKEVVLPEVSKLNDSVMNKNHRDQTLLSAEKSIIEQGKWAYYYLHIPYICYHTDKQTSNIFY